MLTSSYDHAMFGAIQRPLLPGARALELAQPHARFTAGWRPYDLAVNVATAAGGSQSFTLALPSFPAYLLGWSISAEFLSLVTFHVADETGNTLSSSAVPGTLLGVPDLPAPLAGLAAYSPLSAPRVITSGWLRLQVASTALIGQTVRVVLYCLVPNSGQVEPWVTAESDLATRADIGEDTTLLFSDAPAVVPLLFTAAGDNILYPAADRPVSIVALDLYTDALSDPLIAAGTAGGTANRVLVHRKPNFQGSLVYLESTGVTHFDLNAGEALLLNQTAAIAWSGAVKAKVK